MKNVMQRRWVHGLMCVGWVCLLGLSIGHSAWSEGTAGQAAPYLREGLGARALGMGNAQVAVASDASAAYWNPAALIRVENWSLDSQTSVLGEGRTWNFINACKTYNSGSEHPGAIAFSGIFYSAGDDLERRSSNRPEPESTFGDRETAWILSGGVQLMPNLALGTNIKLLQHALDESEGSGLGVDLALWQRIGEISWGVMYQDAYSQLDWGGRFERLPALWRVGGQWDIMENELRVAADGTLEYSSTHGAQTPGYHLGAEYFPLPWLAVRAGVDDGRPTGGLGAFLSLSHWGRLRLNYALTTEQLPGAGLTHMVSLGLDIAKTKVLPPPSEGQ